jgi:protein O-mannosyl-transferase
LANPFIKPELRAYAAVLLAIVLSYLLLSPGIHGIFLLDDYPNLKRLELLSEPTNLQQLMNFALSGDAGASGRTLSMLSFALQADDWPSSPQAFKQINLFLHLFNAVLVFLVFKCLGDQWLKNRVQAAWVAAFVASAWLMHPINLSTVFYVVQRMTELSSTFVLLGLLGYIHGRKLVTKGRNSGYVWATTGVLGGMLLAAACKESGVLLPLFVLVIETTLLKDDLPNDLWRRWQLCCLAIPIALVVTYLALHAREWILEGYHIRAFTLPERVLTETRVLCRYLLQIVAPQPASLGLFHDDFPLSRSLLEPLSTVFAAGFLLVAFGAALFLRKRMPIVSFGILWFFAGHSLESSVIPLEIYFEHRNYLPMLGILFMMGGGAAVISQHSEKLTPRLWKLLGTSWMLLIAFVAWQQAMLWGDPPRQALEWAKLHPDSTRAQHHMAGIWIMAGIPEQAERIYRTVAEKDGGNAGSYLIWLSAGCRSDQLSLPEKSRVMGLLQTNPPFQHGMPAVLDSIVSAKEENRCGRLESEFLKQIIETLISNPNYTPYTPGFFTLMGRLELTNGNIEAAVDAYTQSLSLAPSAEVAMLKIKALVTGGSFKQARAALDQAREINRLHSPRLRRGYYDYEIDRWVIAIDRIEKESTPSQ